MEVQSSLSMQLFDLDSKIEEIDSEIYRLQMKRDDLAEERRALKARLMKAESRQSFADWNRGQKMTMDLLMDEVGHDVFDI